MASEECNKMGARLARKMVELVQGQLEKSDADFEKFVGEYPGNNLILLTNVTSYGTNIWKIVRQIAQGLDAMQNRDTRYAYFHMMFSDALRMMLGAVNEQEFLTLMSNDGEGESFRKDYLTYKNRMASHFRAGLAELERSAAQMETGKPFEVLKK